MFKFNMLKIKEKHLTKIPALGSWPATVHLWEKDSILAVNTALSAQRPLLVRGEPGVGKSQLARAAAVELNRSFYSHVVNAACESRDLQYRFDAVQRLAEAQMAGISLAGAGTNITPADLAPERFLAPGPLWWAFNPESAAKQEEKSRCSNSLSDSSLESPQNKKGSVLLIDEIDKADADLPNGLLETLGNGAFSVDYLKSAVTLEKDCPVPLVVITTNEERELPAAFLRRCLVLQLRLPDKREELIEFLKSRGRIHFEEQCADTVMSETARQLITDRKTARENNLPAPGLAEYLDILRALTQMADTADKQMDMLMAIKKFAFQKYPKDMAE
jgi:MoxR-like ATPase